MSKKLYIAYGSNLNHRQMAMRCPTAKLVGTGTVEGYELQFKGQQHSAFATIAEKPGASVPVAIWSIRPRDEWSLDIYEGYPTHYHKDNLSVQMDDGSEINAMVYVMNHKMNFGIPTQKYYNAVYEGYENCGLDVDVLNKAVDHSIDLYREKVPLHEDDIEQFDEFDDEYQMKFE